MKFDGCLETLPVGLSKMPDSTALRWFSDNSQRDVHFDKDVVRRIDWSGGSSMVRPLKSNTQTLENSYKISTFSMHNICWNPYIVFIHAELVIPPKLGHPIKIGLFKLQ